MDFEYSGTPQSDSFWSDSHQVISMLKICALSPAKMKQNQNISRLDLKTYDKTTPAKIVQKNIETLFFIFWPGLCHMAVRNMNIPDDSSFWVTEWSNWSQKSKNRKSINFLTIFAGAVLSCLYESTSEIF